MSKARAANVKEQGRGLILGLVAFERISAVEGVRLTSEMKRDLQAFDRQRLTAEERTRFISGKYGQKSA